MAEITCAFSGHRPGKLPWGTDETDPRCVALKTKMEWELRRLCESGVRYFICGMARGTDQYFIEVLQKLRQEYEIYVEAALPCRSQNAFWTEQERQRYREILRGCDRVFYVEEDYSPGCMLRRNRYMVEHAQLLMTVFDGSSGGTASTIAYARARGLKIISLWR